ncbi:MAG: ABC transporter permease [Planctomycetota bacterium]|nr:ABC transporter permease [Planctomycetota bacterium]MDI6786913.1 ABC transporter permease [Planctomycetota bacterium]
MSNIITLARRELAAYFLSPLAYVILTAFIFFCGYFFRLYLLGTADANSLRYVLELIGFTSLIISPMITMRLLAEEKKSGTLETLMTAPVTEVQVVIAKYISALIFFIALIIPTVAYVILLLKWGNPDMGAVISGYTGLLCLTGVFLSIGIFVSSLTTNQIVAVVLTFLLLLIGWVIGYAGDFLQEGVWKEFFKYIGFFDHYDAFRKGLIDSRDVVYCLSLIVFFLFLTVRAMEARRWR